MGPIITASTTIAAEAVVEAVVEIAIGDMVEAEAKTTTTIISRI